MPNIGLIDRRSSWKTSLPFLYLYFPHGSEEKERKVRRCADTGIAFERIPGRNPGKVQPLFRTIGKKEDRSGL
jgi:hypothetical protein